MIQIVGTERIVLSLAGGAIGVAAGFAASEAISRIMGWTALVTADAALMSFGFAAAVAVFFGCYPARKAARARSDRGAVVRVVLP